MHRRELIHRLKAKWLLGMYLCVLSLLAVHIQTHPQHNRQQDHHCGKELHYHKDHGHCELPAHNLAPSLPSLPQPCLAPMAQYAVLTSALCPVPPSTEHPRFFSLRAPPALSM
ncbi:MAG: hypothetical protein SOW66_03645 [Porphyromonas sp.]|nr:hypothetical protein [Porphyromonas sp.]